VAAAEVFAACSTELGCLLTALFLVRLERSDITEAANVSNLRLLACFEIGSAKCRCALNLRSYSLLKRSSLPSNRAGLLSSCTLGLLASRGRFVSFGPFRFQNLPRKIVVWVCDSLFLTPKHRIR
jgi:hypothetical protein